MPWLQDFSLGVEYGEREVRAQIDATLAAGIDEYLLWDPTVTYASGALTRNAPLPTVGSLTASSPASRRLVQLPRSRSPEDPVRSGLAPNELGVVPVPCTTGCYPTAAATTTSRPTSSAPSSRGSIETITGPVTASALVMGRIDLPRGASPVVLTFDDSATSQAALLEDGRIDPDSAVGIMLEFARDHPDFRPAGTFYVNREPFGDDRARR